MKCSQHEGPKVYRDADAEHPFSLSQDVFIKSKKFRCPLKGEWFLSGAIIEAYKACNDLSMSYHIAIPAEKTGLFCRQCGQATYRKKEEHDTTNR